MADDNEPTYSLPEVAQLLGKADSTMRLWARTGVLETEMIDNRHLVRPSELRRILRANGISDDPAPHTTPADAGAGAESFNLTQGMRPA